MGLISSCCENAALCLHQSVSSEVLGCAVESIFQSTYRSKQELVDACIRSVAQTLIARTTLRLASFLSCQV